MIRRRMSRTSALGRLTRAITSNGSQIIGDREFTYDALGNTVALNDALGNTGATITYSATDRDRACRITYTGGLGGVVCNVVHDALGNVVSQPTRSGSRQIGYFASGAVRTISQQGVQASFKYDPFGHVQELDVQSGSAQDTRREHRYGGVFERRDVSSGGASTSILIRHVPGPGGIVASRRGIGGDWIFEFGESPGNRYFTDEQGAFVQSIDYQPFGEATSTGAVPGSANYTSYQWNSGDTLTPFGLSHLGARLFDPVIGRFLSRDPVMPSGAAASSNPYAFARNDPLNSSDPTGLQPPEEPNPMIPMTPFGSAGGASSGGCGRCHIVSPTPPTPAPTLSGGVSSGPVPVVGSEVRESILILKGLVAQGDITAAEASKSFRNFVGKQVYTNQLEQGGDGWCACATRQMALKHAGVIRLGLSYANIKIGLRGERSPLITKDRDWEDYHFNWTDDGRFITSGRLNPGAIAQIARNPIVGTGSTTTMHWKKLTAQDARRFLDEGAMIAVTTGQHWMTAVHDPFLNQTLIVDPIADKYNQKRLTPIKSFMRHPYWDSVTAFYGLVQD